MRHLEPLSIILVKRGGAGDRVLFRYPYSEPPQRRRDEIPGEPGCRNPYLLPVVPTEDQSINKRLTEENVTALPCKILATLFAGGNSICDDKLEIKIDDIRFVGHPVSVNLMDLKPEAAKMYHRYRWGGGETQSLQMFQVVFALHASAKYSVVNCYHDLSHLLAVAIRYEERRNGYLQEEAKKLLNVKDELEDSQWSEDNHISPYAKALEVSQLARDLKKVFLDVSQTGYVEVRINGWSEVLFCLPQKVHKKINRNLLVEPSSILKCMELLRPYHALLLLHDAAELLNELPLDYNTGVRKVIEQASPIKNFRILAADTNLSKLFVFQISMQLLYWGKATIIYPLCSSNCYVIGSKVPSHVTPILLEKFSDNFDGFSLAEFLERFSYPSTLAQALPSTSRADEYQQAAKMVVWCLQHHLIVQLHTYLSLALTDECDTVLLPDSREERTKRQLRNDCLKEHKGEEEDSQWPPLKTTWEYDFNTRKCSLSSCYSQHDLLAAFTEKEKETLLTVPAASNFEDLRLFLSLAPYFNGHNHLEEIMYHANVRRSVLNQVVDKFRGVLIKHEMEDVNITTYFNAHLTRHLS